MPSYASEQSVSLDLEFIENRMSMAAFETAKLLLMTGNATISKTTVADGLTPMPEGVYTVYLRRYGSAIFIHPSGRIHAHYSPADPRPTS